MQKVQVIQDKALSALISQLMRNQLTTNANKPKLSKLENAYYSLLINESAEAALAFLDKELDSLTHVIHKQRENLFKKAPEELKLIWDRYHEGLTYCQFKKLIKKTSDSNKSSSTYSKEFEILNKSCLKLDAIVNLKIAHMLCWDKRKKKKKKSATQTARKKRYSEWFEIYLDFLWRESHTQFPEQDFVQRLFMTLEGKGDQLKEDCLKSIETIEKLMRGLEISTKLNLSLDEKYLGQLLTWMTNSHFQNLNIMSSCSFSDKEFKTLAHIVRNYATCLSFVYDQEAFVTRHNPQNKSLLSMYQEKLVEVMLFGLCVIDKYTKGNQTEQAKEMLHLLYGLTRHYDTENTKTGVLYCEIIDEDDIDYKIGYESQNTQKDEEKNQNELKLSANNVVQLVYILHFQAQAPNKLDPANLEKSTQQLFYLVRGAFNKRAICDSGLIDNMWKSEIAECLSAWVKFLKENSADNALVEELKIKYSDPLCKENPWLEPVLAPLEKLRVKEIEEAKPKIEVDTGPSKVSNTKIVEVVDVKPEIKKITEKEKPKLTRVEKPKAVAAEENITWSLGHSFHKNNIFPFTPRFSRSGRYFTTLNINADGDIVRHFAKTLERGKPGNIVFFKKKNYRVKDGHVYIAKARPKGDWRVWAWSLLNSKGQTMLIFDWLMDHKEQKAALEKYPTPKMF